MPRQIAHLYIEDFRAALEELRRPELRGRPFVLSEPGARAVVQGVSRAARAEGIGEGMLVGVARRMHRGLGTILADRPFYREEHGKILGELDRFSPIVEGVSPGRYFIDITGAERLWGLGLDAASRIGGSIIQRHGMPARIGIAANRLTAQVVARVIGPERFGWILPGAEPSFLAPLTLRLLPGIGRKTASFLADLNISRVGELAAIPEEMLAGVFGRMAPRLLRLARGMDPAPVVATHKTPKTVFSHILERDEIDRERLAAVLFGMAEEAGWTLRLHNRRPARIGVAIHYADGASATCRRELPPDAVLSDRAMFRAVHGIFLELFQRRVVVRRIDLEFSDFSMPFRQLALFPREETGSRRELEVQKALDKLRLRHGRGVISWGRAAIYGGGAHG